MKLITEINPVKNRFKGPKQHLILRSLLISCSSSGFSKNNVPPHIQWFTGVIVYKLLKESNHLIITYYLVISYQLINP